MTNVSAQINEIFTSIQGEGIFAGERQVFIRFSGCNISCSYCDTKQAITQSPQYRVEQTPGKRDFKQYDNPAGINDLSANLDALIKHKELIHSICLTGGEPLLQVEFLKQFLPEISNKKIKIYLETNGTLPNYLMEIIDNVDIISMDIKIPSSTGCASYAKEHKEFLGIAAMKEAFVKIVVVPQTNIKEIDEAAKLIADVDVSIPLVIQPATLSKEIKHIAAVQDLLAWQAAAKRRIATVRVIPQVHKMSGVL